MLWYNSGGNKCEGGDLLEGQDVLQRVQKAFSKLKADTFDRINANKEGSKTSKAKGRITPLYLAPVMVVALLATGFGYIQLTKPMELIIDGQAKALVKNEKVVDALLAEVQQEFAETYGNLENIHHESTIAFSKEGVKAQAQVDDSEAVKAVLKEALDWKADGIVISVDDVPKAVLSCTEEANAVLDQVKKNYLPSGDKVALLDAAFVEEVEIIQTMVDLEAIDQEDQVVARFIQGTEKLEEYVLQSGDSLWSIARANHTTVAALEAANPQLGKVLKIGDVIKLTKAEPLVTVKTVVEAVVQENVPFKTVYQNDSNRYVGQQTVIQSGTSGKKEVTYQIAQINGVELERKVLSETLTAEPVDKVVSRGTKTIVASRGSGGGSISWPLSGRITSPYGPRGRGYHTGIDIDANYGNPIYAAAGGTVKRSAYSGGYGHCIIVDHGNGLSTLYAHLSQRNVSVGQKVSAGQVIGLAGSTGNSTGVHLHFEVQVNGRHTNPMNYLR